MNKRDEKYFHLRFTVISNIYSSETCTGTFKEWCPFVTQRPTPNTKCASECYGEGRWGDSWCYTDDDEAQWGAPCEKCYPQNKGRSYAKMDIIITETFFG